MIKKLSLAVFLLFFAATPTPSNASINWSSVAKITSGLLGGGLIGATLEEYLRVNDLENYSEYIAPVSASMLGLMMHFSCPEVTIKEVLTAMGLTAPCVVAILMAAQAKNSNKLQAKRPSQDSTTVQSTA